MAKKELLKDIERLKIEFNHIQIKGLELLRINDNYFYLEKNKVQITPFYSAKELRLFMLGYNVLSGKTKYN